MPKGSEEVTGEASRGTAVLRELMNRFKNPREARLAQERLRQVQ